MIKRDRVLSVFSDYVSDYDASDPKIRLKIDHTYRVAGLCETIAGTVGAHKDIAWLCGILHDIGRFEQVRRYNTFSDAKSVDHAGLSLEILFGEGLLDRFEVDLDNAQKRILEKAIGNHSLYRLEPGLNETETTYCNILRDADKIDIFRVNCDTPMEEIYNVTTQELKSSPVSPEVKDCFSKQTAVLRSLKKYPADHIVGHICLVFELVYPVSREIAKEQGYIGKMMDFKSDNSETAEWFKYMRGQLLYFDKGLYGN